MKDLCQGKYRYIHGRPPLGGRELKAHASTPLERATGRPPLGGRELKDKAWEDRTVLQSRPPLGGRELKGLHGR